MSLLNVDNRNKQLRLNHVFKIVNNKCPLYMNENFTYVKDVHSYSTRANMYNFSVPKCYGKENMTFFYCAIKDWNDLPNHIKNINNHIGFNGDLLYNIPEDMKYFKKITSQEYIKGSKNVVIMGYKTWMSIPDKYKPLSDRINIIISKNHFNEMKFEDENIKVFNDFNFCYEYLKQEENNGNLLGEKFIIGGSQLYNHVFDKNINSVIVWLR